MLFSPSRHASCVADASRVVGRHAGQGEQALRLCAGAVRVVRLAQQAEAQPRGRSEESAAADPSASRTADPPEPRRHSWRHKQHTGAGSRESPRARLVRRRTSQAALRRNWPSARFVTLAGLVSQSAVVAT